MKSVYTNLLGKWVRLDDNPACLISNNQTNIQVVIEGKGDK